MLLLATEIWRSHGGIQRYMQILVRILIDRGERLGVVTLLDDCAFSTTQWVQTRTKCSGGSKWRFCLGAYQLTRGGYGSIAIVGHVALLPLVWALRQCGLIGRYVVVLHGIEAWRKVPVLSITAARDADAVVATTSYTAREFCFYNKVRPDIVSIIPLACTFPPKFKRPRPPSAQLKLLSVARLSSSDAYKGIDITLKAVRGALDTGLNVALDIVGSGSDMPRLKQIVHSLALGQAVTFHGSVSDDEMQGFFSTTDVFVLPSKKEGFGIVYLEAMAAGLPCIGANHGGTPEVIQHGENGFLVEYGDVERLVFYLHALGTSPDLYEKMSICAQHRAMETLGFGAISRSWANLLTMIDRDHNLGKKADRLTELKAEGKC